MQLGPKTTIRAYAGAVCIITLFPHAILAAEIVGGDQPGDLTAHRAIYEVELAAQATAGNVDHVTGVLTIDIRQNCDSTSMRQSMSLRMTLHDGTPYLVGGDYSGLENKGGDGYEFQISTVSNGIEIEHYLGTAARPGTAAFAVPDQVSVALSEDVYFPLHHFAASLAAAQRGDTRFHASYFGGSQPLHAPYNVDARIEGPFPAEDKGQPSADVAQDLTSGPWWRIVYSYFGRQSVAPDYSISQDVHANGVVRRFLFDYGQIVLAATLQSVSAHPQLECGAQEQEPAP